MRINRKNYEHYFLLYTDNELTPQDRIRVEDFAAANEDLKKELETLKETVLPLSATRFAGKNSLYKEIPLEESVQQQLLLMLDNELPGNESACIKKLISSNLVAKKEYDILLQTKLNPGEKIIFPNKQLLYKKQKDRVVLGSFIRWAAAAVLLGFGGYFGMNMFSKNEGEITAGTASVIKTNLPQTVTHNMDDTAVMITEGMKNTLTTLQKKHVDDKATNVNNETEITLSLPPKKHADKEDSVSDEAISVKPVRKDISPIISTPEKKALLPEENTEPFIVKADTKIKKPQVDEDNKTDAVSKNAVVPLASLAAAKSENKIFYINEDVLKRSKVGGFFRKVKKFAEQTANLKKGHTLQIAGFEIAAR